MLPLWVEFFDDLQQVRGRSANTVMAYRRDLALYEQFLAQKQSVSAFYDFMTQHQLSARSQARSRFITEDVFQVLRKGGFRDSIAQ